MRITCLHTADSNIAVFDNAARQLGLDHHEITHLSLPDLLTAAESTSGMTVALQHQTAQLLYSLATNADRVLLTCSTLGLRQRWQTKAARHRFFALIRHWQSRR